MMREAKTYCQICQGMCGLNVTLDDADRVVSVEADRDHAASKGYACLKGLQAGAFHNNPNRLLRPLKKVDGRFVPIPLEQALNEIAQRLGVILEESGGQAAGVFRGTASVVATATSAIMPAFVEAIGGQFFTTMTIDQSAKFVAWERMGTWDAGKDPFELSDVWGIVGNNPLVSVFSIGGLPVFNVLKQVRAAKARGTKFIVIDPRECEIAKFADIHLQPYPGEDAAVAAGLIRIVLDNNWHDRDFCETHVDNLEALREAVAPFTVDHVAARSGVSADKLLAAAELFAKTSKRGAFQTGTGPDMSAHSNVAEHLYECLNVICGRFAREGDRTVGPAVMLPRRERRAQANSPARLFEKLPRTRVRGAARFYGETPAATLAEEILTPGEGRIRALFVTGANPALAVPDQNRIVAALQKLDLLVVTDPLMTATAQYADYVLPPYLMFERPETTFAIEEVVGFPFPYAQYGEAIAAPPPDSDLCDDAVFYWEIARRLNREIVLRGQPLEPTDGMTREALIRLLACRSYVPFDDIRAATGGKIFDVPDQFVLPADEHAGRFDVMADDVRAEMALAHAAPRASSAAFPYLLAVRRMREVMNTSFGDLPKIRARRPFNPLSMHPEDADDLGLEAGDAVEVASDAGSIPAIVALDQTLKRGVVTMTHGWGGVQDDHETYRQRGSATTALISADRHCESLNAMPRMSGIPVRVARVDASRADFPGVAAE